MSKLLTQNNFYQIKDKSNQKVVFKYDKNKLIDHNIQIADLNVFPDVLDLLGSDTYVIFPANTFCYKSALVNEFRKRTYFNLHAFNMLPGNKFLAYDPYYDTSINYNYTKIPIVFLSADNQFCDASYYIFWDHYRNDPHGNYRFPDCFDDDKSSELYLGPEGVWVSSPKLGDPFVWITNFYDTTYGFIS